MKTTGSVLLAISREYMLRSLDAHLLPLMCNTYIYVSNITKYLRGGIAGGAGHFVGYISNIERHGHDITFPCNNV